MKTFKIGVAEHGTAQITILAVGKRGDLAEAILKTIHDAGFHEDDFRQAQIYDTKTADHDLAHNLYRQVRRRMRSWTYGRGGFPLPPMFKQGAGPQNIFATSGYNVKTYVESVLHGTTNRDAHNPERIHLD